MTFIVGEDCIKCKHTDCVEVCPVDCFYEGPNMLVIHPDECIDCALCEPECPVDAIFADDEVPEDQLVFVELNAELAELWPTLPKSKILQRTPKNGRVNRASLPCWNANRPLTSTNQGLRIDGHALASKLEIQCLTHARSG